MNIIYKKINTYSSADPVPIKTGGPYGSADPVPRQGGLMVQLLLSIGTGLVVPQGNIGTALFCFSQRTLGYHIYLSGT